MSFEPALTSVLDVRLAEIDDRLRAIQTGLADDIGAPSLRAVQISEPGPPADDAEDRAVRGEAVSLLAELRALAAAQERLLQSIADLLAGNEPPPARRSSELTPARRSSNGIATGPLRGLGLSVGPLDNTEALRAFELALAGLDGVSGVEIRGYEGGDRALLDVHLEPKSSLEPKS